MSQLRIELRRELRFALLTLVGILCVLFLILGVPLIRGQLLDREFMSHELNQKIVARNPNWSLGPGRVDITDLFDANISKKDLEIQLTSIGYHCKSDNSSETGFSCDREAGYSLVCRKMIAVLAEQNTSGMVPSVGALFNRVCL